MFALQILHTPKMYPRGFWLQFLWLFSIGCKYERDDHGTFIMLSLGVWKFTTHLTLSMDNPYEEI